MLKYIVKIKSDKRKLHFHVQCPCTMNNWIQRGLKNIRSSTILQYSVSKECQPLTFHIRRTHIFYAESMEKKRVLSRNVHVNMNKNTTPCPRSSFPVPFALWPCDLWVTHHSIIAVASVPFILITVVVFWVGGIQGSETGRQCQSALTASLQSVMVVSNNVS